MARNEEKAQAMLNRFVAAKKDANREDKSQRPYLASECTDLADCDRYRNQIIREVSKKVSNSVSEVAFDCACVACACFISSSPPSAAWRVVFSAYTFRSSAVGRRFYTARPRAVYRAEVDTNRLGPSNTRAVNGGAVRRGHAMHST